MIAKNIQRKGKSRYKKLAEYIAAAADKGEKLHKLWMQNCNSGSSTKDLQLAIKEIESTQSKNTRSKADKTYHLLISFQEGEKPTDKQLVEIEKAYAEALGFENHQRICATHQNTNNFHIHVAYNKVNPETMAVHTPYRDFGKLEKVSRDMEQKYGLAIDNGRAEKLGQDRQNTKAKDYEAHTWQQSFDSYVKEHKKHIKNDLEKSKSWLEFHEATAQYGIRFKLRGAGMAIKNLHGKGIIKSSGLGREFSKKALEDILGPYIAPEIKVGSTSQTSSKHAQRLKNYKPKPILKHKSIPPFWKNYMGIKKKDQMQPGSIANTFKEFLIYQALEINDPLAMVLIHLHSKMLADLTVAKKPDKASNILKSKFNVKARLTKQKSHNRGI